MRSNPHEELGTKCKALGSAALLKGFGVIKVRLAVAINQIIQGRKLSQMAASRRLNVNQPKVSALSNYQLDGFSVERLMNFLTALDRDVDIIIRRAPRSRKGGRILVTAA
jgi:predicted XRE-type DNA-binding protein